MSDLWLVRACDPCVTTWQDLGDYRVLSCIHDKVCSAHSEPVIQIILNYAGLSRFGRDFPHMHGLFAIVRIFAFRHNSYHFVSLCPVCVDIAP
jgi:hypothetical protein